jgi:hypothetical protein
MWFRRHDEVTPFSRFYRIAQIPEIMRREACRYTPSQGRLRPYGVTGFRRQRGLNKRPGFN